MESQAPLPVACHYLSREHPSPLLHLDSGLNPQTPHIICTPLSDTTHSEAGTVPTAPPGLALQVSSGELKKKVNPEGMRGQAVQCPFLLPRTVSTAVMTATALGRHPQPCFPSHFLDFSSSLELLIFKTKCVPPKRLPSPVDRNSILSSLIPLILSARKSCWHYLQCVPRTCLYFPVPVLLWPLPKQHISVRLPDGSSQISASCKVTVITKSGVILHGLSVCLVTAFVDCLLKDVSISSL